MVAYMCCSSLWSYRAERSDERTAAPGPEVTVGEGAKPRRLRQPYPAPYSQCIWDLVSPSASRSQRAPSLGWLEQPSPVFALSYISYAPLNRRRANCPAGQKRSGRAKNPVLTSEEGAWTGPAQAPPSRSGLPGRRTSADDQSPQPPIPVFRRR